MASLEKRPFDVADVEDRITTFLASDVLVVDWDLLIRAHGRVPLLVASVLVWHVDRRLPGVRVLFVEDSVNYPNSFVVMRGGEVLSPPNAAGMAGSISGAKTCGSYSASE